MPLRNLQQHQKALRIRPAKRSLAVPFVFLKMRGKTGIFMKILFDTDSFPCYN